MDSATAPAAAHADDLTLARACAKGCATALGQFDALCLPVARAAIRRIDERPQFVDEVVQELWVRLLCPGDGGEPPRIARYGGRGPLLGWVRTAAVRLALNRVRERRRAAEVPAEQELTSELTMAHDPELGFIREHYRDHFRQAFMDALGALSSRERTLLRLHLLDALTEEQIGTMYRAHRVTIARWLGKARQELLHRTQCLLSERLGLSAGQLLSMTGLVPSHLDLSLSRLLRTPKS